ncbi:MAG: glycoside hydrolase family 88 protein, partial [Planctomycetales bacterium]|nr:glycoside hydrolase family 88 protein [Planctomycetales bacterium]
TEWTQGFQFGCPILLFDATNDRTMLNLGREATRIRMASHVTHFGVHDHGFNNISTYGNLWRLAREGRFDASEGEIDFYEMAIKASGAVQANRWSRTIDGDGYIYSFNGPHSLFSDTIRSLRALALAHRFGHRILGENDRETSLLERLVQHARVTAKYNVYFGNNRDAYDISGRVAHESIFNTNDGCYRCPSTQQGYSPFTTWTRGLAWIITGYAEQLEFLDTVSDRELEPLGGRESIEQCMTDAAMATCQFYCDHTPTCGVPYWDTGAPGLAELGDYLDRPADPFNDHEPVDSSAAAIACQGLLRFGRRLQAQGNPQGDKLWQAGLTTLRTLLQEPYLSTSENHQGLLLHTVYHRPRNWDYIPGDANIPYGESCMWGDYHLLEAAVYISRLAKGEKYYTFFGG